MKKLLISSLLLAALLLPCQLMATSAFDGTWKIDVNKVHSSGKPQTITLENGMYACDCSPPIHIKADGSDHPISGRPDMDTLAMKVVDGHSVSETAKKDGKVVYTRTYTVSPDGKTATFVATVDRDAVQSTFHGTLTRVAKGAAGSHALAGAWQTSSYQSVSANMLTSTYKIDGNTVSMTDGHGQSYNAKLGGKPVAIKGDPGKDTIAVKMVGNDLQETRYADGKLASISRMSVSADGTTLTTLTTYKPSNHGITLVAMKQ